MRYRTSSIAAFVLAITATTATCQAQLVDITWNGGTGNKNWQDDLNWTGGPFPNDSLKVADLSVNLGANLNVDLGASGDITVAGVSLGSQSGAATTNIISSGAGNARLVFFNEDEEVTTVGDDADFDNNTRVDGKDFLIWQRGFGETGDDINKFGDANDDDMVDGLDLAIWQEQYGIGFEFHNPGNPFIESIGVAGATNTITANIHAKNQRIEIGGTKNLTIDGDLTYEGDMTELVSNAGIGVISPGVTVTMNGNINMIDADADDANDFYINSDTETQGTMIINGLIQGAGTLQIGSPNSGTRLPLGTVRINSANTTFGGGIRAARGNLVLNHDMALGTGSYRQQGPLSFGYNLISTLDTRNIANDITLAQWQTIKGTNSLELSGEITQTNNRGIVNMLPAGKKLTLSGDISIFEIDEFNLDARQVVIDGTGNTEITGTIRDLPADEGGFGLTFKYGISKSGTGSLLINVGPGDNNHNGPTTITMGNFHYANNDSLNASGQAESKIVAHGGAVGVDTHPGGQNLGTNTTFLNKIDPSSTGGLMLATTDTTTALNFTTGSLANAANMSVAAPEQGMSYTGTITPAGNTYKLGGGVGTLTLPNAQLSNAGGTNSLVIKNGGTVRLLGDNTYTGTTTIQNKYSNSQQRRADADTSNNTSTVFYEEIAPVLEVDDLANGGVASSIGSATTAASNLVIQGATLRYNGTGDSTNRLFTIGTGGATIESSGGGAVVFSNSGSVVSADTTNKIGTLRSVSGNSPGTIYEVNDTRDVVAGMTVRDPDPDANLMFTCGVEFTGANCIPADSTVTSLNESGTQINISDGYPDNIQKLNTTLVFGPVERGLTLAGTNGQNNEIASVLSDSAGGGVLSVTKSDGGKWILSGANTYTGDTNVEAGILSITNSFLDDDSAVRMTGGVLNLNFGGSDIIDSLFFNGSSQTDGTWGRLGHPTAMFTSAFFTGNGLLNVGGVALGALTAAVPEPNALMLATMASLAIAGFRRRSF